MHAALLVASLTQTVKHEMAASKAVFCRFSNVLEAEQSPNLRFADDIDGLAGEEEELANLVERLDKASTAYSMEISAEKTKLMANNTSGINTDIKMNGQKLETVTSFKSWAQL